MHGSTDSSRLCGIDLQCNLTKAKRSGKEQDKYMVHWPMYASMVGVRVYKGFPP